MPKRPWRAVALDSDETTGSWGRASLLYRLWLNVVGQQPEPAWFVSGYLDLGGARPGLRGLLQCLADLRERGAIDEVVVFTSASDQDGWVTFLKRCLELYAGTPNLFGRVLAMTAGSPRARGRMLKDLSRVGPDPRWVLLVDDRPEFAWGGWVVKVPQYAAAVNVDRMVAALYTAAPGPDGRAEIAAVLRRDAKRHPPSLEDFSQDQWLGKVALVIKRVFEPEESRCKRRKVIEVNEAVPVAS